MKPKIILLARDCDSTAIVFNHLVQYVDIDFVIFEKPISRKKQFSNRVKKIGFLSAVSQVLFMLCIFPFIKLYSQKRKKEIFREYSLDEKPIPADKIVRVETLNTEESRRLIKELNPGLILVNGTKIISGKTLKSVAASFVNIHVGITPLFRGVHGGYWAIANGRDELFGTTIHYVDTGVDTGGIIEQVFIKPHKRDNFYTYPYLQYAICLPALQQLVESFNNGIEPPVKDSVTQESVLWYHPTVWQWIKNLKRTLVLVFAIAVSQSISGLLCA